ncbi:unnamed protein product [Brassicogethes aeneus]|uniref:Chitinase domain-containing protein 1 n=1 Tax=Brassicogethes aeneus TaxID=1431903 RepID=A0A9P0BHV1_BRAAE|nr:unnamed protein product [Brassicogethes aeneus]
MLKNTILYVLLITLSFNYVYTTLSKKSPKGQPKEVKLKQEKPHKGPQNYTVFAKNLITQNPDISDIIINHAGFFREVDEYNFDGIVLGYVTPWNNHGYDVAKIFGNKFTHISPVWLQSFKDGDYNYKLAGTHDIDIQWISNVKNAGRERNLKIVPRVVFEEWTGLDFTKVITERDELQALTKSLVKNAKYYKFDGYVIEVFPQLATRITFEALVEFLRNFADELALEKLETILVIPPKRANQELFNKKHFDALYDHFTAFSLMTYDYSTPLKPGPNSPISWVEKCVSALTTDTKKT